MTLEIGPGIASVNPITRFYIEASHLLRLESAELRTRVGFEQIAGFRFRTEDDCFEFVLHPDVLKLAPALAEAILAHEFGHAYWELEESRVATTDSFLHEVGADWAAGWLLFQLRGGSREHLEAYYKFLRDVCPAGDTTHPCAKLRRIAMIEGVRDAAIARQRELPSFPFVRSGDKNNEPSTC